MKEDLNLDDLKRVWQKQAVEKNYSTDDIFKILKKKSITSVKWVFIISLIELLGGLSIYLIMFANIKIEDYHEGLIKDYGNWAYVYEFMTFIIYGVTFLFIYKFFKSYKKIQVQSSVKDLSLDIIKFRKVVNNFIYFNLGMLIIFFFIKLIPLLNNISGLSGINWVSGTGLGIIVGIIVILALAVGALWLYYYLVYGTFQRRLKRNLRNLDSIED